LKLRRAAFLRLLQGWADENCLKLIELPEINPRFESDMTIVVTGGHRVETSALISALHARSQFTNSPFVIISDREQPEDVIAAFRLGASGYLPSCMDPNVALAALTFILNGGKVFPPSAFVSICREGDAEQRHVEPTHASLRLPDGHAREAHLTGRQQEVTELLSRGLPNKLIARHLNMTEATVKVHVRQILR